MECKTFDAYVSKFWFLEKKANYVSLREKKRKISCSTIFREMKTACLFKNHLLRVNILTLFLTSCWLIAYVRCYTFFTGKWGNYPLFTPFQFLQKNHLYFYSTFPWKWVSTLTLVFASYKCSLTNFAAFIALSVWTNLRKAIPETEKPLIMRPFQAVRILSSEKGKK